MKVPQYCHPPVNEHEDHQTDDPLDNYPGEVEETEQDKPETSMFASLIGQLHMSAPAPRTLSVDTHVQSVRGNTSGVKKNQVK